MIRTHKLEDVEVGEPKPPRNCICGLGVLLAVVHKACDSGKFGNDLARDEYRFKFDLSDLSHRCDEFIRGR